MNHTDNLKKVNTKQTTDRDEFDQKIIDKYDVQGPHAACEDQVDNLFKRTSTYVKETYNNALIKIQEEKKYKDSMYSIKREPLVLHESPNFIGLIYSQNKKVKRHL